MHASDDRFYRPSIVRRVDISPTLWTIRLKTEPQFSFQPGKYATLGVEGPGGKRWERPYSIVSAPYEDEIEFFLELVPGGDLTPRLHLLQTGDRLLMRKVSKGRFVLDTQSGRTNHLLLSTVTGVAPFVSYVRSLYRDWKEGRFSGEHKLFLLNGASRSLEFGYQQELERFAAKIPWLQYLPTISRPWEEASWQGETGRVDDVLRKHADHWQLKASNCVVYMCGHPEMIEHSKGILKRVGFGKENLKEEFYWWAPAREPGVT